MADRGFIRDAERKIASILGDLDEELGESGDGLSFVSVDLRAHSSGLGGIGVEIITTRDEEA